jgi:hypothetical protein
MPVEIRELRINVTVNEQKAPTAAPSSAGRPDSGKEDEKKAIISECVEQVMEIISNKKER